jgi:IS5 family transposase
MKRRAAAEPSLGHLKAEHRLERNRLKGVAGDAINAILSAAATNFHKLLGVFWRIFLLRLMRIWGWIPVLHEHPPPSSICKCLKAAFSGSTNLECL